MTSTFHTPVVEEFAGPRDICQAVLTAILASGVLQQLFELQYVFCELNLRYSYDH